MINTILLIFVMVILIVIVLFMVYKKQDSRNLNKNDLELLKNEVNNSNFSSINDLKENVKEYIENHTDKLNNSLTNSSSQLLQMIYNVSQESRSIPDIKEKVFRLDNLLSQNNKAGKSGEYLLERIFQNITGSLKSRNILFEYQYCMKTLSSDNKKLKPDLFIKGDGKKFVNIPIDSKFSFNAYEKMTQENIDENLFKQYKKEFISDVKDRIKETTKYVVEEENVVYAIMFVPSEVVFSHITSEQDLIDYAFKNKVIIAGPSTLVGIIESIDKYMSLFDDINNSNKKIEALAKTMKYIDNYDNSIGELFKIIENLNKKYDEVKIKYNSLNKQYNKMLDEIDAN